jgi:hypothetical protein
MHGRRLTHAAAIAAHVAKTIRFVSLTFLPTQPAAAAAPVAASAIWQFTFYSLVHVGHHFGAESGKTLRQI